MTHLPGHLTQRVRIDLPRCGQQAVPMQRELTSAAVSRDTGKHSRMSEADLPGLQELVRSRQLVQVAGDVESLLRFPDRHLALVAQPEKRGTLPV